MTPSIRSHPTPSRLKHRPIANSRQSESKGSEAKLPVLLQEKVLLAFFEILQARGSADVSEKREILTPLMQVCRHWKQRVGAEYLKRISLDLREWVTDNEDSEARFQPLDVETLSSDIEMIKKRQCECCAVRGGLKLLMDGPESNKRSKGWRNALEKVLTSFNGSPQLDLILDDADASGYVTVCRRFFRLRKLSIWARELCTPVRLTPASFPPTLGSTLTRLDLARITIREWQLSLPALLTLTLFLVTFQSGQDPPSRGVNTITSNEEEEDSNFAASNELLCRRFFDSFQNLRSLELDGIRGLHPSSLCRLRVFSVTHLYVGDPNLLRHDQNAPLYARSFRSFHVAATLSRYFHCQVKHIIFSPQYDSIGTLKALLTSRGSQHSPPFLKRLETIKLAIPNFIRISAAPEEFREEGMWEQVKLWKEARTREVERLLETAKLQNVKIKWWDELSRGESNFSWEPSEL